MPTHWLARQVRFNEDQRLLRQRKAVDVARVQDAHARLQEIAIEAGQLCAPDLAAAARAAPTLCPPAPAEDEQWPVTVTVRLYLLHHFALSLLFDL